MEMKMKCVWCEKHWQEIKKIELQHRSIKGLCGTVSKRYYLVTYTQGHSISVRNDSSAYLRLTRTGILENDRFLCENCLHELRGGYFKPTSYHELANAACKKAVDDLDELIGTFISHYGDTRMPVVPTPWKALTEETIVDKVTGYKIVAFYNADTCALKCEGDFHDFEFPKGWKSVWVSKWLYVRREKDVE